LLGYLGYGLTVASVALLAASGTRAIFVAWGLAATVPFVCALSLWAARALGRRLEGPGGDSSRRTGLDPSKLIWGSACLAALWALSLFAFEPDVFRDATVPAFLPLLLAPLAAFGCGLVPRWPRWAPLTAFGLALLLLGATATSLWLRTPAITTRLVEHGATSSVLLDLWQRLRPTSRSSKVAGAGTCHPGVVQPSPASVGKAKDSAPDILLVMFDAARWDHTSLGGYKRDTTPNLKRWAEHGLVFEDAYSNSASTRQTFRSLLSGLLPSQLAPSRGITRWAVSFARGQETIASYLAAAGYRTISIQTSAALDSPDSKEFRGFQERDFEPMRYKRKHGYSGNAHIDRVIAHLSESDDRPRFVFTHMMEAHQPYIPGPHPKHWGVGKSKRDRYDSALHMVDRQLDRIISFVMSPERRDHTILVLAADHGMGLGERGGMKQHGNSLFDDQTHVPLLMFGAGVKPGRITAPATLEDVFPTLIDFAGLRPLEHVCGESLAPVARGKEPYEKRPVLVEIFPDEANPKFRISWVTERYKLMVDVRNGSRMLYDMKKDPKEAHDLSKKEPDVLHELEGQLGNYLKQHGRSPREYGLSERGSSEH
jgi:arylsulfatase A-like enzyme